MTMRKLGAALAFGAALYLTFNPNGAHAQSAAQEQLGQEVAHHLLIAVDFAARIRDGALKSAGTDDGLFHARPEWGRIMVDAVFQEAQADEAVLDRIIGHAFATKCTPQELEAGAEVLRDDAMVDMLRHAPPKEGRLPGPEAKRAAASPAGRQFMAKLSSEQVLDDELKSDVMAALLPGALRRAADAMEAAEKQRSSAPTKPTS